MTAYPNFLLFSQQVTLQLFGHQTVIAGNAIAKGDEPVSQACQQSHDKVAACSCLLDSFLSHCKDKKKITVIIIITAIKKKVIYQWSPSRSEVVVLTSSIL
jgi:hypothetical protein